MTKSTRSGLLTLALLLIAAPAASAAFPGRNGVLAGWATCGYSNYCTGPSIFFETAHGHPAGGVDTGGQCIDGYGDMGTVDCNDSDPAWSPDGRRIAFARGSHISVARGDGSDPQPVPGATGAAPAWSPDGRRLVFQSGVGLSVIDAEGGTPSTLVADGAAPAWSSTGRIAFERGTAGHPNLFSVQADGTGLQRLTSRGGATPNWSPHASRVAFVRGGQLWTIHADGTHPRRLMRRIAGNPVWSPDGRAIAFQGRGIFDDTPDWFVARLDRLSRPWRIGKSGRFDWQPRP